jgi:N-acetylneuraminic acid mutarotase
VCFVIKNKLYVVGGSSSNTVYQTTINSDGTLSNWTSLPNFPISFQFGRPLLIKNRIYIFGVYDSSTNTSKIYYATYDDNGNIGSWTYVANMPLNIFGSIMLCTDNYVFSISGFLIGDGVYTFAAYSAPILANGSIGSWEQITSAPAAVIYTQGVIAGNRIYFIGGYNNNGNYLVNVYSATFTSGITDYTPYYTPYYTDVDASTTFKLPDLPSTPYSAYYIKT